MQDASSHGLPSRGSSIEGADMKLTQKAIAALVLPESKTDHIEWDSDLPGFGIRIRAGGARTWIYQYKIGNQHRRITLGNTTALSPACARATAGDLHAQVAREARSDGFQVIDLLETFRRYPPGNLVLSPTDDHPNALAHHLAAQAISQAVLSQFRR